MHFIAIITSFIFGFVCIGQAVPFQIVKEPEAANLGLSVYTGTAHWDSRPDELFSNDKAFASVARLAHQLMEHDLTQQGNPVPKVMVALLVKDKDGSGYSAYFGSSIKNDMDNRANPRALLNLIQEPVPNSGDFIKARINMILENCLNGIKGKNEAHTQICAEPIAIQKYIEVAGGQDFTNFQGLENRIIAYSSDNNGQIWPPCGFMTPQRVGCKDLVAWLRLNAVRNPGGFDSFTFPDAAAAPPFSCSTQQ